MKSIKIYGSAMAIIRIIVHKFITEGIDNLRFDFLNSILEINRQSSIVNRQ
jgi:hypothetical protein